MTDTQIPTVPAVDDYVAMWNEPDPGRRAGIVARAFADDGAYVDPLAEATGHDALNTMVTGLRQQFPGHRIERTTGVDAHHGLVRFGWRLTAPDGSAAVEGLDVAIVDADGRLSRVVGFFGPLPPLG